ncbi:MAG TPA: ParB N-terminal domain-containing protein [Nitrososphaerales archaeon]|nr:ParB N-terminal domain-containing protein [Nitrososphaerales archaeon]
MTFESDGVRVDLRPVSSLLPHEETIPEQLNKIVGQIQRDGVQKDPVIVDRESGTVLDGMHRLAAFSRLGLENVVCCMVDYSSSGIELRRWARVYRTTRDDLIARAMDELGITKEVTLAEAFELLDSRRTGLAVLGRRACRVPEDRADLGEVFRTVKSLDEVGRTLGWQRTFAREDEVDVALEDGANVLLVQRLTKQDVLNAARTRSLFPCKTSMHTIDPRPVALDFPIADINGATPKTIAELLKKRSPRLLPPNSEYEGRRYKERLLVLHQH